MELKLSVPELEGYLAEVFPQVGTRFRVRASEPGRLTVAMTAEERDLRPGGTVSGPTLFLLADCAYYMATLSLLGREALAVTTNASIDFMRKPGPGELVAEARVLKLGRVLSVGDVLIFSQAVEGPVARAGFTYSIPPRR